MALASRPTFQGPPSRCFALKFHRRIQNFLGESSRTNSSECVLTAWQWRPNCSGTFFYQTGLNRIVTTTQAYWDVSGAEAAFKTIQKLFSNLPNLKKVTCRMSESFIISKTNTGPRRKNAWGRHRSDTKTTPRNPKCSDLCWQCVQGHLFKTNRCSWIRRSWRSDLIIFLFSVHFQIFIAHHQGPNEGTRATISRAPNYCGGLKVTML